MGLFREIEKAVSGHGHGCGCGVCLEEYQGGADGLDKVLLGRLAAALFLFAAAWIVSVPLPAWSVVLSVLSVLTAGYDRILRAIVGCVRRKTADEDLLMCLVVIAAAAIGRAVESAAGMLLLQIGALLQGYAAETVRRALAESDPALEIGVVTERRTRAEEFIAHFTRIYTPVVMGIAVVIAILSPAVLHSTFREGIYRALILLVIACPCAFAVSIPLAYLTGIGALARQGIFLKNTWTEEALCRVGAVVLDKTTALEGDGLRVTSVRSDCMDADVLLRIAAHACAYSDGVFSRSIKAAYQGTIYIELIQSFWQEPGRGITVEVDGVSIILGTEEFMREHGVDPGIDAVPELSGYLAIDGRYAGRILFGNVPREDAAAAAASLSWDRERAVVMLTEDDPSAAEKFARSVGIGQYYAACTPERKAEIVSDLSERLGKRDSLLFVGDAAKDAACFAAADIGLSAPRGAEAAEEITADPAGPAAVLRAMEGAKATRAIVLQNVFGALGFKLLVLLLDMLGVCPLWLAVFADVGVTLAVTVNTLRLLLPRGQVPAEDG